MYFFVPETNGRTLEQMDHVFRDSTSEADEERRKEIESEILRAGGLPTLDTNTTGAGHSSEVQ